MDAKGNSNNFARIASNLGGDVHSTSFKKESNSEVTSPAQYTTLLQAGDSIIHFKNTLQAFTAASSGYPLRLRYLLHILFYSGARVNEVLSIRSDEISMLNHIKIKASKGGVPRIVQIPLLDGVSLRNIDTPYYLFYGYSRFYVYRLCKKLGLYVLKKGSVNYSVTHSFRVVHAHMLNSVSENSSATAAAMGHKRYNTINHYAKDIVK